MSPSQALTSHSSGGSLGRIPAAASASSARSTSSGLIIRSRSWRVSGPPRAQLARLPPSRNGTSASRSAAAAFFSASLDVGERLLVGGHGATVPAVAGARHGHTLATNARHATAAATSAGSASRRPATSTSAGARRASAAARRSRLAAASTCAAGRRPHHPRRARAGGDRSRTPCATLGVPVLAVLGNHDWHSNRADELAARAAGGGHRRARAHAPRARRRAARRSGGGHQGLRRRLRRLAHPRLRRADAARGLRRVDRARPRRSTRGCARSPVPVPDRAPALRADHARRWRASGADIWTFLGTDRLAAPLREHHPDLVLHGHAHAGTFEGRLGDVPVYNVSVPFMGEDFWVFEMTGAARVPSEVH